MSKMILNFYDQKAIHGIRNPWTPENIWNMNMTWIWPTGFRDGYSPKSKLPSCKKHQKPGQVQETDLARCPWSPHRSSDIQMSKALRGRSFKKVNCICMIEKTMENLGIMCIYNIYIYIYIKYYSRRSWKHRETLCFQVPFHAWTCSSREISSNIHPISEHLFPSILYLPSMSPCQTWWEWRRFLVGGPPTFASRPSPAPHVVWSSFEARLATA